MSDEQLHDLCRVVESAAQVAANPINPWFLLRLRVALDEAGVDWRAWQDT